MKNKIDYNVVVQFMKEFGAELLTYNDEIIIDYETNTYAYIGNCESLEDVEVAVMYNLCRPIGKSLDQRTAKRLLKIVNDYFKVDLTVSDMRCMYRDLCYINKLDEFKQFISDVFPVEKLESYGQTYV